MRGSPETGAEGLEAETLSTKLQDYKIPEEAARNACEIWRLSRNYVIIPNRNWLAILDLVIYIIIRDVDNNHKDWPKQSKHQPKSC